MSDDQKSKQALAGNQNKPPATTEKQVEGGYFSARFTGAVHDARARAARSIADANRAYKEVADAYTDFEQAKARAGRVDEFIQDDILREEIERQTLKRNLESAHNERILEQARGQDARARRAHAASISNAERNRQGFLTDRKAYTDEAHALRAKHILDAIKENQDKLKTLTGEKEIAEARAKLAEANTDLYNFQMQEVALTKAIEGTGEADQADTDATFDWGKYLLEHLGRTNQQLTEPHHAFLYIFPLLQYHRGAHQLDDRLDWLAILQQARKDGSQITDEQANAFALVYKQLKDMKDGVI